MSRDRVRAAKFLAPGQLELGELKLPTLTDTDVLVRPTAVGLCGTDIHILDGEFPATPGIVLGHEIAGIVERVGAEVEHVAEGDLITVEPHVYCTVCRYCRSGREHLCLAKRAFGVHLNGGLAERLVVPSRTVFGLPPGMSPILGCMTEPLGCCLHAIDRLSPVSGTSAMVIGAGPAGLILTRLLRLHGVTPLVVLEPRPARRALSLEMGADVAVDPSRPDHREQLLALTAGHGYDAIIEAAGLESTLELAIDLVARGGSVLIFGVAAPDASVALRPLDVFTRELTILGTVINPFTHQRAVNLLPRMNLDAIDVASFALDNIAAAIEAQRDGVATKIVVHPN